MQAVKQLQEQARLLQSKSSELAETRRSLMVIRDENLSLAHQTDLLRTEVLRVSNSAKRRTQSLSKLDLDIELVADEFSHSHHVARGTPLSIDKLRVRDIQTPRTPGITGHEKGAHRSLDDRATEAARQLRRFSSSVL